MPNWVTHIEFASDPPYGISLNAAAPKEVSRDRFSWALVLEIEATTFRPNGFPSQDDFDVVYGLEERLESMENTDWEYVGRRTQGGRYQLVFYTTPSSNLDQQLGRMASKLERKSSITLAEDADWSQFRQLLWPTKEQWQSIKDQDVLESLKRNGDTLDKARFVDHWMFFHRLEARDAVKSRLAAAGFEIVVESESDTANGRFVLQFKRTDSVQGGAITRLTVGLLHLAEEHGGAYDGWETSVEK